MKAILLENGLLFVEFDFSAAKLEPGMAALKARMLPLC